MRGFSNADAWFITALGLYTYGHWIGGSVALLAAVFTVWPRE
jgi:hypothetical protein